MRSFRSTQSLLGILAFAVAASGTGHVCAQQHADSPVAQPEGRASASAQAGQFLPTTIGARTDSQHAYFLTFGGYDSTQHSAQAEALVDVSILDWLAARAGFLYTQRPNRTRPTLGLRARALSQERFGIDLGIGGFYRPEGFTESEGEIELVVAVARQFGRLGTFANVVYGQDPEAAERDGELRLGALYTVSASVQAGMDARLRVDLGSEPGKRRAEGGADYDLVVGPTASYAIGPIAAIVQAGVSVFGVSPARPGAVAILGVAGAI